MAADADEPYDKFYDESMRFNMLKEILPPETIADMAVYLASERGKYVTGQSINVCGGFAISEGRSSAQPLMRVFSGS